MHSGLFCEYEQYGFSSFMSFASCPKSHCIVYGISCMCLLQHLFFLTLSYRWLVSVGAEGKAKIKIGINGMLLLALMQLSVSLGILFASL